ncbi:capsid assembly scaffolding protein Gp46 family protein [Streptococcus acidominimus]|uniref:Phage scaffold protein n=1 Tax=Streptococcus acidominimus TaxID=1326 RepID=A0A4Y9FQD1_STRAI|nr:DUF4355 domain-containing protein [Streptococcus acidominimus]MBF0847225.1 phage scaffold protein [Streptococcus danieliae]MBF0818323.1 phage scaffold protein [Streptococcus acidominimus]MBF0838844.1 phage scaffold protein [Streptococcus acidominimus]MBF0839524.1 phage scaffold protein [Streptococcus acidominimus]TFU31391.1 phage scaffold protein [Streptococcus acidominimus]
MSEFKTIETQKELDRIISERLARQKNRFMDYDQLKDRVEELETENLGLNSAVTAFKQESASYSKQIEDLEEKVASYEQTILRTRIALQNGLPYDLADRLRGNDEAELIADAEWLSGFLNRQSTAAIER